MDSTSKHSELEMKWTAIKKFSKFLKLEFWKFQILIFIEVFEHFQQIKE